MKRLATVACVVVVVLLVKVFVGILYEYQWYLPPDFEASAFLGGRRASFEGLYRVAFYLHILAGPLSLFLGAFLVLQRGRNRFRRLHRRIGRLQFALVLGVVTPSGLVMAREAYAGPIAGAGFAMLSLATSLCILIAVRHAIAGNYVMHRLWASRTFLLLCSPLLLRVISGSLIVLGLESVWSYRLNAWISWLVPCLVFELWNSRRSSQRTLSQRTLSQRTLKQRTLKQRSRRIEPGRPLFPIAEEAI